VQSAGRCLGSGCKRDGPLRLWKQHDHFIHTLDQNAEANVLVLVVRDTCDAVSSADGEDGVSVGAPQVLRQRVAFCWAEEGRTNHMRYR
jgi:hypothetical protein